MDKMEMMKFGDAAVMSALADMYAILNGRGEMLSRIDGDRMVFSPRLECDGGCSTLLFDDGGVAQHVIDDILLPQESGEEFHVFKFTPVECHSCCGCGDDGVELTFDDDCDAGGEGAAVAIVANGCGDGCACGDKSDLECAIERFRDDGDETTASWLEELKMRKDMEAKEQLPAED